MTLKEILDKSIEFLKKKNISQARFEAELIMAEGLKLSRIELYLQFDRPMKESETTLLRDLISRRGQGEPTAYLFNKKEFFRREFYVNPDVLIPRPETEMLVERALEWKKNSGLDKPRILDLGAGSGCLGITLALEIPEAEVHLVDISEKAIQICKKNSKILEVSGKINFHQASVQNFKTDLKFDLIVANPPYISKDDQKIQESVLKFEPHQALFAEDHGLKEIKDWIDKVKNLLTPEGLFLLEFGCDQKEKIEKYLQETQSFKSKAFKKDFSDLDRMLEASI